MNEGLIARLRLVADQVVDVRAVHVNGQGFARHSLGFTLTRDHIAQAESRLPLVRAEGLYPAPKSSPFKTKWTYVVFLADQGIVQRHLVPGASLVTLQQTAASCVEAGFRESWMHALPEPDPMRIFAYFAKQGGLDVNERVVTAQAAIHVSSLDTTMLVFWVVPSLSPDEPDFLVKPHT